MIALSEFTIKKVEEQNNSALYEIGPLPKGYGHTLGNILSRVLRSSIPGAAITSVKIDGVLHEYSTLAGINEDMLQIILSLKNVVFNVKTDDVVELDINVKASGNITEVKAGDFSKSSDVEVVNPDYVITKLTDSKANFKAKVTVQRGVGYQLPNESVRQEIGVLPVDANFSPVKLVKYDVVPTRVGQQTELDQINLAVETNGAITSSDALSIASNILNDMATNFVTQTKDMVSGKAMTTVPTQKVTKTQETFESNEDKIVVAELNLSTRLSNALLRAGFDDLRKLEGFTEEELANIRGMGEKSLEELKDTLKKHKVTLI